MKKIFLTTFLTLAVCISNKASAMNFISGLYVNLPIIGYSKAQNPESNNSYIGRMKDSSIIGTSLGCYMDYGLRTELSFNYRSNYRYRSNNLDTAVGSTIYNQDITASTVFVNLYKDFEIHHLFTTYLTTAIGISRITLNPMTTVTSTNFGSFALPYQKSVGKNSLSWQVGLGGSVNLSDRIIFDLGYRYTKLGSFSYNYPTYMTGKLGANEILASIRLAL